MEEEEEASVSHAVTLLPAQRRGPDLEDVVYHHPTSEEDPDLDDDCIDAVFRIRRRKKRLVTAVRAPETDLAKRKRRREAWTLDDD